MKLRLLYVAWMWLALSACQREPSSPQLPASDEPFSREELEYLEKESELPANMTKTGSRDTIAEVISEKAKSTSEKTRSFPRNVSEKAIHISESNTKKINSPTADFLEKVFEKPNISIISKPENTSLEPGSRHTLPIEIASENAHDQKLQLQARLPEDWKLVSVSSIDELQNSDKKVALLSFFIPSSAKPGSRPVSLEILQENGEIVLQDEIQVSIAKNPSLEIFAISYPKTLQAGAPVEVVYGIRNNGNVRQEISLKSNVELLDPEKGTIAPDSLKVVKVQAKASQKIQQLQTITTYLEVSSKELKEPLRAYSSTRIFPSKIQKKDAYFRFPVRASLNYNSYTYKDEHFSTISAEVFGDGYLDLKKDHHLNFVFRLPKQQYLKRFGVTDQYSLIYSYKDRTRVFLGDHAYYMNRLGFDNRYGMGFRIDQKLQKWEFSTYYSKPRLYEFNSSPLFGAKATYRFTDSLQVALNLAHSSGSIQGANPNIEANPDEKGQILTASANFKRRRTQVEAEASASFTNQHQSSAAFLNVLQGFGKFSFNGSYTLSSEYYFGSLRNSRQFSNSLFYNPGKWNFAVGHTVSRVNQRLNPLFYAAEPYFENTYALAGYRVNRKHSFSLRAETRQREDQLEPKSYFYKERSLLYRYLYSGEKLSFNFNGRLAKTQNLLVGSDDFKNTYSINFNSAYRLTNALSLRGGMNHNYSNRYGYSDAKMAYTRYHLGFNLSAGRNFRWNATYNSGFSPDENYLRRDFVTSNFLFRLARHHQFETRITYYENAGAMNRKELLALGKYTYFLGVPLKRVLDQGSLSGTIGTSTEDLDVSGIRILAAGKEVVTNKNGHFELNNLPVGQHYLFIDESSLPASSVVTTQSPIEINIQPNAKHHSYFEISQAGGIKGYISLKNQNGESAYRGYVKISNEQFSYMTESNEQGIFHFDRIVPGNYSLKLLHFRNEEDYDFEKELAVSVQPGELVAIEMPIVARPRKIKFSKKTYNLGKKP